ncbi:endonuclease III domain-containing protein [Aspergillus affinis]|uniref:endonuclease III domain-containing protein n=1 Tax=Aspergillus affinis TaxID=1070780 RepID=UPI0022FEA8F6|nr:DNA glycosylase [Aspergillus affinis]KAI9041416.1 DNA glycosylase [Aspergillus affinis]
MPSTTQRKIQRKYIVRATRNAASMAPILKAQKPRTRNLRLPVHDVAKTANLTSKVKIKPEKKIAHYKKFTTSSPFPGFKRPSPQECREAHRILSASHGERDPTATTVMNADGMDRPTVFADPLDGLVYAILCQATNERNAIRQVQAMIEEYGSWTDYHAISERGESKLQDALSCGGLHVRKAKFIMSLLRQVKSRHGVYSLNHLWPLEDEQVMEEFLSYNGVGPKTASCVIALTLNRQKFVVDTHIYRITGFLGWRPIHATPEQARAHLERKIPDEFKYSLHLLFITHGRECPECKAGSKSTGSCRLRKAFRDLMPDSAS